MEGKILKLIKINKTRIKTLNFKIHKNLTYFTIPVVLSVWYSLL